MRSTKHLNPVGPSETDLIGCVVLWSWKRFCWATDPPNPTELCIVAPETTQQLPGSWGTRQSSLILHPFTLGLWNATWKKPWGATVLSLANCICSFSFSPFPNKPLIFCSFLKNIFCETNSRQEYTNQTNIVLSKLLLIPLCHSSIVLQEAIQTRWHVPSLW